ncbi:hypothetical protein ACFS5M_08325 [Lacinutrix iliipiscaria]|uniref:TonB-dependent Receptor Plug Domain n=1 Tax=Lacinutrix iliipiscaria TaxID=1230532 RepID=A0ABW5WQG4_9FLAO
MNKTITLLLTLSFNALFSQISIQEYNLLKTQIPQETVHLQVNTNVVLAGEFLNYKSYHIIPKNHTLSNISTINYVTLLASDNTVIFNHKLLVKNSVSYGDFFIPPTIKTGHYKLISYTNWTRNNVENPFSEVDIFIINPYSTESANHESNISEDIVEVLNTEALSRDLISDENLKISSNKINYRSREKVEITITNTYTNLKNASISVRKTDSVKVINKKVEHPKTTNYAPTTYYLPELRGELVSGKITSNNGASLKNKSISLSIAGTQHFIFKNVTTNDAGQFHFTINENYSHPSAFVQVQELNAEDYAIEIYESTFHPKQLKFNQLLLNENIKDWVKNQSINNQVENAYYNVKTDSIIARNYKTSFYDPLATTYKLNDFTRFKTMKETFIEVIHGAAIINETFEVRDFNNTYVKATASKHPLVLIDGVLITNHSDAINYNPYDVDTISLVEGQYTYGSKIYNGIISFKTIKNEFNLNYISNKGDFIIETQLQKPEEEKIYYSPNYDLNDSALKRIPDFRNQLLWLPNIELDTNKNNFSFFTSDNSGTYEIIIEGFTKSGKHIKANTFITVN